MGLIFDILAAPVTLPTRGLTFIFNKIVEQVNNEMLDDGRVRMQLLELQTLLDTGQISQEEFYEAEEELLDRLDAILAFKEGERLTEEDDEDDDDEDEDDTDDEDAEAAADYTDDDEAADAVEDAMLHIHSGSETQRL